MILFVFCCKKKYHRSLILGWFLAFSAFPSFCFIFSLSDASFHRRNVCGSIASCLPIFVRIKSSCLLSTMNRSAFSESRLSRRQDRDVHPCRYSSLCFLWMLVGNRNDSAQINFIIWAFVARRIGSVCPRLVLLMPAGCSADAHPSVRKGSCGGHELL